MPSVSILPRGVPKNGGRWQFRLCYDTPKLAVTTPVLAAQRVRMAVNGPFLAVTWQQTLTANNRHPLKGGSWQCQSEQHPLTAYPTTLSTRCEVVTARPTVLAKRPTRVAQ